MTDRISLGMLNEIAQSNREARKDERAKVIEEVEDWALRNTHERSW